MMWVMEVDGIKEAIIDERVLERRLWQLHEENKHEPAIVHIIAPDGSMLNVAVGAARSFLNHIASGGWPARHSVGQEQADGCQAFRVANEVSEVEMRCLIPVKDGINAAVEFFNTANAPSGITWEDD